MKLILKCLFVCTFMMIFFNSIVIAQNSPKVNTDEEEIYYDEEYQGSDKIKEIFFDAGYGANKFGFGLGFRYWRFGASFGLAGIGESMPDYEKYGQYLSLADAQYPEKYSSIDITADLYYFHPISQKITAFVNIGYGVGTDSVFATSKKETTGRLYPIGAVTESSITYGLGVQYLLEKWIGFGLGYHSRRGVYAQFTYYWY